MKVNFYVRSSENGPPQALIPNQYKWDFVEYLAFQRVNVLYTCLDRYFIVSFPSLDRAAAKRLLDEWAARATRSSRPAWPVHRAWAPARRLR